MLQNHSDDAQPLSGLGGSLRLLAIVLVLALAGLAILGVLDVIPIAALGDLSIKIGLLAAIGALATGAIWLLTTAGRR